MLNGGFTSYEEENRSNWGKDQFNFSKMSFGHHKSAERPSSYPGHSVGRLGKTNRKGKRDQAKEAQDAVGWPFASLAAADWSSYSSGTQEMHAAGSYGPDEKLCSSADFMRSHQRKRRGLGLDTGFSDCVGLRGASGCRWCCGIDCGSIEIGKGLWLYRLKNSLLRHNSSRGQYSLSDGSGLDAWVLKDNREYLKNGKRNPETAPRPCSSSSRKNWKESSRIPLICKNSGKKTESHQVAPEADEILARHGRSIIHRDEIHGSKALGKGKTRSQSAGTAAENGYKAHAASQIFYQTWQAHLQQDHLAFSPRGAINCTRKEWKESRIRPEMAGESSSGWLCLDSYPFIVKTTVGFRLCSSSNQRTYRFIWRAAEGIRIRSRSMEPTAHSTNQGQRGKKSSDCSERKGEMEGFRSMQKANDTGARAGRGLNWMLEEDRLQQAPYKKYTRNVKISSKNSLAIKFDEFSQRYGNCNGSVRAIGTFIEMPVILTSNP